MKRLERTQDLAAEFAGVRFLAAEFMYRARPTLPRQRLVFDYALRNRLSALSGLDGVLFICNDTDTVASLEPLVADYPDLRCAACITNPEPIQSAARTPFLLDWPQPDRWQRFSQTDRWCRICCALTITAALSGDGYLIMPAEDAVYGLAILERLVRFSIQHRRAGFPAAVSPYTVHQHSAVPDADIPEHVIGLINTAFGRDALFGWKIRRDRLQAFWGKMGMIPFGLCGIVLENVESTVWEDDLEIDRVLRAAGYGVRCLWVRDSRLYRQTLPVFDENGVRAVLLRTLHYSLNIPSARLGESSLNFPLGPLGRLRQIVQPGFRAYNGQVEQMIADCNAEIQERLARCGASWVDWGAYRYVMRVGDPTVEVWGRRSTAE